MDTVTRTIEIALQDFIRQKAKEKNIEKYKILHNKTVRAIAQVQPTDKDELAEIKGIGPAKLKRYGPAILRIVNNAKADAGSHEGEETDEEEVYSVGGFLDALNRALEKRTVSVTGEVSERVNIRGRSVYFAIKDPDEDAVLSCFLWKDVLDESGIELEEGMEVVVTGFPNVYKPTGRFSLHVRGIQLTGEGALAKAFEKLKAKLEKEGLFEEKRKRPLPKFPERIALVTADGSDARRDFLTHLGNHGLTVVGVDVRVEGLKAVDQITGAIARVNETLPDTDVLVLTRGGGSLESLQAFNHERVARALVASKIPTVVGVGHERDVTIADMVADVRASTPTDAGKIVGRDWEMALERLRGYYVVMHNKLSIAITNTRSGISTHTQRIERNVEHQLQWHRTKLYTFVREFQHAIERMIADFYRRRTRFENNISLFVERIKQISRHIKRTQKTLYTQPLRYIEVLERKLSTQEEVLESHNPARKLAQGYSMTTDEDGNIIKHTTDVTAGDMLTTRVSDGDIESEVLQ